MNILVEYDDECEQKILILCFCQQQKHLSLYSTLIHTLKLDIQGLRDVITEGVSITERVSCGTALTAHSFQLQKPITEVTPAELSCYLQRLPTGERYLIGLM